MELTENATPEHEWLQRMIGAWHYESQLRDGPEGQWFTERGTEIVRSVGPYWIMSEMRPEQTGDLSIIIVGYEPAAGQFVGTFISSRMAELWHYKGQLDSTGRRLTLASTGPAMDGSGGSQRYEDIIEYDEGGTRWFRSQAQGPDGQWVEFMRTRYEPAR
jgi:hypothetical protein